MAAFQQRSGSVRAIVRRKNYPTLTKTFSDETEARAWAAQVEHSMKRGAPVPLIAASSKQGLVRTEAHLAEVQIVALAQSYSAFSGVYFLTLGEKVVYVGMSSHVLRRIAEHDINGRKFDGYHVVPCSLERAAALEKHYIQKLRPAGNKNHMPLADLLSEAAP